METEESSRISNVSVAAILAPALTMPCINGFSQQSVVSGDLAPLWAGGAYHQDLMGKVAVADDIF